MANIDLKQFKGDIQQILKIAPQMQQQRAPDKEGKMKMSGLVNALKSHNVRTDNNALTNFSSGDANVDLFFTIGSARNADISNVFKEALETNSDYAIRTLLWGRDARKGSGERQTFRNLFSQLIELDLKLAKRVLNRTADLGRWDDVFGAFETPLEDFAVALVGEGLVNAQTSGLVAKWMPRNTKHPANRVMRNYLKMSPKQFRKLIVGLSNTVEQKMSAKQWSEIDYEKVPSVAMSRYQKAFRRNDGMRYEQYLNSVARGEKEIKAGAIYPYDVIRSVRSGDEKAAEAQWNALPDYTEGNDGLILPVVDVSGSMTSSWRRVSATPTTRRDIGRAGFPRTQGPTTLR